MIIKNFNSEAYRALCSQVDNYCLDKKDFIGLLEFYESGLREYASDAEFNRIKIKNIDQFAKEFAEALQRALAKARQNSAVQALYFEYFFDGGDASDGNFFLCESFDEDDDEWACNFSRDGVVLGPSVLPYMNFDPEFTLSNELRMLGELYVDANLLITALVEIEKLNGIEYPFGFAQHDSPIVIFHSKK